jgi:hypothetical protein
MDIDKDTTTLDQQTEKTIVQFIMLLWSMTTAHDMKGDYSKAL